MNVINNRCDFNLMLLLQFLHVAKYNILLIMGKIVKNTIFHSKLHRMFLYIKKCEIETRNKNKNDQSSNKTFDIKCRIHKIHFLKIKYISFGEKDSVILFLFAYDALSKENKKGNCCELFFFYYFLSHMYKSEV